MKEMQLFTKIKQVEDKTGTTLPEILNKVPFTTVVTAFKEIQVSDLIEMVQSTSINNLIHGLTIIDVQEIEQISIDRLKTVLKFADMNTIEKVNKQCGSRSVIIAINKMTTSQIEDLLVENNLDVMIHTINKLAFVNK